MGAVQLLRKHYGGAGGSLLCLFWMTWGVGESR